MPFPNPIQRIRSFFALEWIGDDDLYLQAFSSITPSLLVGRRPTPDHLDTLSAKGVTHVVSCLEEQRRTDVAFLGDDFDHLFLPANDEMNHDLDDAIERFLSWVDDARATDSNATVLVHCEVGVSRSASLAIALLMRDEGRTFLDAFELARSRRVQVLPNLAFASQLQHLEHRLQPTQRTATPSSLAVYLRRHCSAPAEVDELQAALEQHDFDAPAALRSIYGGEIPRVVQGARSASR